MLNARILAAVLALGAAAPVLAANPMAGCAAMFENRNIIENAVNSADHTTLVAAVKAAGLVETLSGKGPFTVFAPPNEAFPKWTAGTVETLLKPENKDQLTRILTCHVLAADESVEDIMAVAMKTGQATLKTVGGCEFTAMAKDGMLMIKDEAGNTATVTIADVKQSNGVIHVIDTVLLPKM